MKVSFKHLLSIMMALLCALAMVSCGGKDEPDPVPGPDEEEQVVNKGTLKINDKTYDIKTAGYYYDSEYKGYHFVVSSAVINLTKKLIGVPNGNLIIMDLPEKYYGKSFDIKSVASTSGEDGDWDFFLSYVVNGKASENSFIHNDDITSGSILWNIDDKGVAEAKMSAVLNDGTKLAVEYSGLLQSSKEYLCPWL